MAALKIRRRSRLRRKEATDWTARLAAEFGMAVPADDVPIDEAEAGPHRLLLRDNEAFALLLGEDIVPTVRGLLAFPGTRRAEGQAAASAYSHSSSHLNSTDLWQKLLLCRLLRINGYRGAAYGCWDSS